MARTLTINKGGGTDYDPGWKQIVVSKASYGDYEGTRFIELWFEGYPANLTVRVYEQITNGEEWAIGQVFRFANAGITGALDGPDGKLVIKMDDSPGQLHGKTLNAYFYKEGKYSRILKQFAPTVFENAAEKFSVDDVGYWQEKALKYFDKYVKPKLTDTQTSHSSNGTSMTENTNVVSSVTNETATFNEDEAIPF